MEREADTCSEEDLNDVVSILLNHTKLKISEGCGDDALASLLHAIRLTSGEASILSILDDAKKRRDESLTEATKAMDVMLLTDSMLSERGDEYLLSDAFQDGSSLICVKCHGLVPKARLNVHTQYWCPASTVTEFSDDYENSKKPEDN